MVPVIDAPENTSSAHLANKVRVRNNPTKHHSTYCTSTVLQRRNSLHQHLQPSLLRAILSLCIPIPQCFPDNPTKITLHAKRNIAATARLLQTLLQPTSMFPLPGRRLRNINDLRRDAAHRCAMHAKGPLRDAFFQLIQECDAPLRLLDVDLHSLRRDLGMAFELCCE